MKKTLIITLFIILFFNLNAQISEVKVVGKYARIYNEQAQYSGKYIFLGTNSKVAGFNNRYIVIKSGNYARIYDDNGQYTGKFIYLNNNMSIKNVTASAILIKNGNYTRYYDFDGRYTGKYTFGRE